MKNLKNFQKHVLPGAGKETHWFLGSDFAISWDLCTDWWRNRIVNKAFLIQLKVLEEITTLNLWTRSTLEKGLVIMVTIDITYNVMSFALSILLHVLVISQYQKYYNTLCLPLDILHKHCVSSFSLVHCKSQEKIKTMLMQNFG